MRRSHDAARGIVIQRRGTPFLYAMEAGLFKRAGIDAHIDRLPSGSTCCRRVGGAFDCRQVEHAVAPGRARRACR